MTRISLAANISGATRSTTLNGRKYIVVPLTMIVPGVLNGSQGPILYEAKDISASADQWNGMPLILNHPSRGGRFVSGRHPEVIEEDGLGYVFGAKFIDNKLKAEGWFDVEKTKARAHDVYLAVKNGQRVELSTGLKIGTDNKSGIFNANGRKRNYVGIARNYRPDHLAILVDQVGACSLEDGCGVHVNANFGHKGRPGQRGGSSKGSHAAAKMQSREAFKATKAADDSGMNEEQDMDKAVHMHMEALKAHRLAASMHKELGNKNKASGHAKRAKDHEEYIADLVGPENYLAAKGATRAADRASHRASLVGSPESHKAAMDAHLSAAAKHHSMDNPTGGSGHEQAAARHKDAGNVSTEEYMHSRRKAWKDNDLANNGGPGSGKYPHRKRGRKSKPTQTAHAALLAHAKSLGYKVDNKWSDAARQAAAASRRAHGMSAHFDNSPMGLIKRHGEAIAAHEQAAKLARAQKGGGFEHTAQVHDAAAQKHKDALKGAWAAESKASEQKYKQKSISEIKGHIAKVREALAAAKQTNNPEDHAKFISQAKKSLASAKSLRADHIRTYGIKNALATNTLRKLEQMVLNVANGGPGSGKYPHRKNKLSGKGQVSHANLSKKGFKRVGKAGLGHTLYEHPVTKQTARLNRASGAVEFDDKVNNAWSPQARQAAALEKKIKATGHSVKIELPQMMESAGIKGHLHDSDGHRIHSSNLHTGKGARVKVLKELHAVAMHTKRTNNAWSPQAREASALKRKAKAKTKLPYKGRGDRSPSWNKSLKKHDKMAYKSAITAVPDLTSVEITGDYVHEPRLVGVSPSSFTKVAKGLKAQGWKSRGIWKREDSQTFYHPKHGVHSHQITIERGWNGTRVSHFPHYKMPTNLKHVGNAWSDKARQASAAARKKASAHKGWSSATAIAGATNGMNEGHAHLLDETMQNIRNGIHPDDAFHAAAEDNNYYGHRPDIKKDRELVAKAIRHNYKIKINPHYGNEEPAVENAWSDSARKASAEARKASSAASKAMAHPHIAGKASAKRIMQLSGKAVRYSKLAEGAPNSATAMLHHQRAADAHQQIAEHLEAHYGGPGARDAQQAHEEAAEAHDDAGMEHEMGDHKAYNSATTKVLANNRAAWFKRHPGSKEEDLPTVLRNLESEESMGKLTQKQRERLVEEIVGNCDCYKDDEETLELLSDTALNAIHSKIEIEEDKEDEDVANTGKVKVTLDMLPPEVQAKLKWADEMIANTRNEKISTIKEDKTLKFTDDQLKAMDDTILNTLYESAKERKKNSIQVDNSVKRDGTVQLPVGQGRFANNNYSGAGAGSSSGVDNSDGPAGGALGATEYDWSEIANSQSHKTNGKAKVTA